MNHRLTEVDILALAAGVESYTNHPLGKAIVEAARVANSANMKVFQLDPEQVCRILGFLFIFFINLEILKSWASNWSLCSNKFVHCMST